MHYFKKGVIKKGKTKQAQSREIFSNKEYFKLKMRR